MKRSDLELKFAGNMYHRGISVDCVVLGFNDGMLKIMLNKFHSNDKWMLPGGFVYKDENVDDAAYRHLRNRTGLKDLYLKQYYVFGDSDRIDIEEHKKILQSKNIPQEEAEWFLDRFITVSYYALVKYSMVEIYADPDDEECRWFDIHHLPLLYGDHKRIIKKALDTIRIQIGYIPIGYELLEDKFTMPELRAIYEAIIGKKLDRRNFQRKMLSIGLMSKLNECRKEGAHKSPHLYKFDEKKYKDAVENGIPLMDWKIT